jgi:O-antigen ligase
MPVSWRHRAELGLLVALCVFLPLYEAPKNLLWLAYALAWAANRIAERDFRGRWDAWDTLIAAWLSSGFVVAAFAGLHGSEWRAAFDIVRNASVLWMVRRSPLANRERYAVLAALMASVVIGLVMGYAGLWSGANKYLELNSVGMVNHTAVYLAMLFGLSAAWFFTLRRKALAGAITALLLVSLFVTTSRGAIGIGLLAALALAFAWRARSRLPLLIAVVAVVGSALFALLIDAEVVEKHEENVQGGQVLARRDQAWALALDTWRKYPWFGVGVDNFALANPPNHPDPFPHAHSLYFNTLAERGLIGSAPVAVLLVAWAVALIRRRPRAGDSDHDWIVWSGAAAAWIVTVGVGTVNTTLHHEHGLLAALLLGLWLSREHSAIIRPA